MPASKLSKAFWIYSPIKKRGITKYITGETVEEIDKKGAEWIEEMKKKIAEQVAERDKKKEEEKSKPLFQVKPFELSEMIDDTFSVMCLGSTRSGKSYAIRYMLNTYADEHIKVCFTNSNQAEVYQDFGDKTIIAKNFFPEVLKAMYKINNKTNNKYPCMAIIDDVVTAKNDKEMLKLLTIYRNSRMSAVIAGQATSILNATGRTNINYVCLFKLNSDEEIEKVVKKYLASHFPDGWRLADKMKYYRQATLDHQFFLINNFTGEVCLTKIPEYE